MINLIPTEEKKEIVKDFYLRFSVIFFIVLNFLILLFLIAILPSYLISYEKKNSINNKFEMQKNEIIPEIDQKAQASIKDLDAKLALLDKTKNSQYVFSKKVIDEIISKKVSGIKITSFSYENNSLEGKKVNITGIAGNREQLLLFRKLLESDTSFKEVNLPISNFAKGSNLDFNLSLISI